MSLKDFDNLKISIFKILLFLLIKNLQRLCERDIYFCDIGCFLCK